MWLIMSLDYKLKKFLAMSPRGKYVAVAQRLRRWLPSAPIPIRLPFGSWWIAEHSALDWTILNVGFEKAEIQFVYEFLRPGMTVLDVGAHHGLYTLLASKRVGRSGKVIAFEPSPRERERLSRHVRFNRCSNVKIEAFALGSSQSQADLYLTDGMNDWCNSLRRQAAGDVARTVRVDVLALDDYLVRAGLGNVDFMKVDVEGAELGLLSGARKLLNAAPRPVILCEVQDQRTAPWGYAAREILEYLESCGYSWFELDQKGAIRPIEITNAQYDGNFVAVPKESIERVKAQDRKHVGWAVKGKRGSCTCIRLSSMLMV
jgi:FkbM family methyltransferase